MSTTTTTQLGGGHYLRTDAAKAYLAARLDGCPPGITSSTRAESIQRAYYENQGKPGWPPKADRPDRSKHVWRPGDRNDTGARALDLPEPARAWMHANGRRYGWYGWRVSGEPWHFEFEPWNSDVALVNRVLARGGTVPGVPSMPTPDPLTPEDDMTPEQAKQLDQIDRRTQQRLDANVSHVLARVTALDAALVNVTKALANVTAGEAFDETKLLTGIRTTINDALAQGVDVTVQVGGKG